VASLVTGRRSAWRLDSTKAPGLHALVKEVAERTGAPMPDLIVLNLDDNASASVVGLRLTRVLTLGVPLLLALTGQRLVALIGHELGHLQFKDNRRALLVQPALTVFGGLSAATRPPR
jgi:Zn-dependent protease with chaperone function